MIPIARIVDQLARRHIDRDKLAIAIGGEELTYAASGTLMWKLAHVLKGQGVVKGDRVGMYMLNRPEYLLGFCALGILEASMLPVNTHFVPSEVAEVLTYARPRIVFTDDNFEPRAREAIALMDEKLRPRLLVLGKNAKSDAENLRKLLDAAPEERFEYNPDPEACFYFALTGGTTGVRKACVITGKSWHENALFAAQQHGFGRDDISLVPGSFSHALPFYYTAMQLYQGGTVVALPAYSTTGALDAINRYHPTFIAAVPTMYRDMLDKIAGGHKTDMSSIKFYISAGSPLLTSTKERLFPVFGPGLQEYYGSTETGWVTILMPRDQKRKIRCVGQPMFGVDIELRRDDGSICGVDEVGLVWKRGLVLSKEYFEQPAATKETFVGEWATAGDLGRVDAEGYLYLVDRKKEMIISGGVNIFPTEIEEVLATVPGVAEVICIGVPHARMGEQLMAVCVLNPGTDQAEWEARALETAKAKLADYKVPRGFSYEKELPKSHAGKILKRLVRDKFWADQEGSIG